MKKETYQIPRHIKRCVLDFFPTFPLSYPINCPSSFILCCPVLSVLCASPCVCGMCMLSPSSSHHRCCWSPCVLIVMVVSVSVSDMLVFAM